MEFIKVTRQDSTLKNGSHKAVFHAQWNDFFLKTSCVFVPHINNSCIAFNIIDQYMPIEASVCMISGVSLSYLSNPSGSPYYNISPTTTPQHSLILDSSVLNPNGCLEPSLQTFGIEPSHLMRILDYYQTCSMIIFLLYFLNKESMCMLWYKSIATIFVQHNFLCPSVEESGD